MNIVISKNRNHIVFIETSFNKDGFANGAPKIGALEWDTNKFDDAEEALEAAKKLKWKLGAEQDNGMYEVVRAGKGKKEEEEE